MKKFLAILAALTFVALPLTAQTYVSQAGSTFFVAADATKTQTATVYPANKSAEGNLIITAAGITGSPSGCQLAMYSLGTNSSTAPAAAEQTPTFTITTGTHTQLVAALSAADVSTDAIKAVYSCTAAYPTAGTITISFAPINTTNVTVTASSLTVTNPVTITNTVTGDPCLNPQILKSSAAVNISGAAGTTSLVAVSGTTAVYVCSFQATVVGTSPTILFEYGTSTACTGTHALSGTMSIPTTSTVNIGWGGTIMVAPASNGLCLVAGGTTPSIQGIVSYVQQ